MAQIPKKVIERFQKTVSKFQTILKTAKDRDINESDTVSIINDILCDVFGFDKYFELTSEFAIRGTYCDLAIKLDNKIQYLIEVKAVGLDLKENHLRQAVNYGANQGIPWIILTNGIIWEIYKIYFEKPINYELICTINFFELNPKKTNDQEKLYILCKEGLIKSAREVFLERVQSINRFIIGAIILNEPVINVIKKELKQISSGLKIENAEIEKILINDVLKRDIIEGENAVRAKAKLKKSTTKKEKKTIVPTKSEHPIVNEVIQII